MDRWLLHEHDSFLLKLQKRFDFRAQSDIRAACFIQERRPLARIALESRFYEFRDLCTALGNSTCVPLVFCFSGRKRDAYATFSFKLHSSTRCKARPWQNSN